MRRRGMLLILVGVLAALGAGALVYNLGTSSSTGPPPTPVPALPTATAVPAEQVLLAAHDIPARQLVTAADVVTRSYPIGIAPNDAFHAPSEIISRTATTQVFAGEILLARQFVAAGGETGASTQLKPGQVLVAFPANDMLSATGAVQAGDHVDILLTLPVSGTTALNPATAQEAAASRPLVAQATMQNVVVYSTGQWTPQGPAAAAGQGTQPVITFIVDHQEALILKYIKDSGGTIDLLVRSQAESKPVDTDPVSLDYLIDLFHFVPVPSP